MDYRYRSLTEIQARQRWERDAATSPLVNPFAADYAALGNRGDGPLTGDEVRATLHSWRRDH